ncbi:MAG: pre-peptidase C-terminal domain-containing protein [Chloroflexota bacterium]
MKPHSPILAALALIFTLGVFPGVFAGHSLRPPVRLALEAQSPEQLVYTITVPQPELPTTGQAGAPPLEGYLPAGAPGDPLLPRRAFNLALPPDVAPESVKAEVVALETVELPGVYDLPPAPPPVVPQLGRPTPQWGERAGEIAAGRYTPVYQSDALFPASPLVASRVDQLRKWRFISLVISPLQYRPAAGRLQLAQQLRVTVSYERAAPDDPLQQQLALSDRVMDERAAGLFYNYDQAQAWYPPTPRPAGLAAVSDYVILTTNQIQAASSQLSAFVAHKQTQGHSVLVATESLYGGPFTPAVRARSIREWLAANYLSRGIEYVLIIGDPTPYDPATPFGEIGDLPMRKCWPMHRTIENGAPAGENIPTDYYYANLTGNWELNLHGINDGHCAEFDDDFGAGGVSFTPQVYVGRIPVHRSVSTWAADLDAILTKTIHYEDSGDMAWRKQVILPMSFMDSTTDNAYLGEQMQDDYLDAGGYTSYTLYQHTGPGCSSTYSSSQDLVDQAAPLYWKNHPAGIVTWAAHGAADRTGIGYGSCGTGNVLANYQAGLLNDQRPAIVFSASCYNGFPGMSTSLGYSLLKNGAVGVISASRMTGYYYGVFSPNRAAAGNADHAYYVTQRIAAGETAGHALYDEKYAMSQVADWNGTTVGNWLDFNLYGDPALSLNDGHPAAPAAPTFLIATAQQQNAIQLTWLDNSDNELGFNVERQSSVAGWTTVGTPGIDAAKWSDTLPACGEQYTYRLAAYNSYGTTYSNQASAMAYAFDPYEYDGDKNTAKPISPASSISPASGQGHSFHTAGDVDWVKFTAQAGKLYTISTGNLDAGSDTLLELYSATGSSPLASNNNCTSGVAASCINNWKTNTGGMFYIKVSNASGEGGCSEYGYTLNVVEGGYAGWPAQPLNLAAAVVSHCQANLSWTPADTMEQGFEVERYGWKDSGGGIGLLTWQTIATLGAGATAYSDHGLQCKHSYSYRVRAYNTYGKSFYSNIAKAAPTAVDSFENDDGFAAARTISANAAAQEHSFDAPGDEDWVKFSASAGQVYTLTTTLLGSENDTVLELYDTNGTTRLEVNDDCGGLGSCIRKWTAPAAGTYYARVYNYHGEGGCPGYDYRLALARSSLFSSLVRPNGVFFNNWVNSSLELHWPDANTGQHAFEVQRWQPISGTLGSWQAVGIAGPGLLFRPQVPTDGISIFVDHALECGVSYAYRLRAIDGLDRSAFSEVISHTTTLTDGYEPDNDPAQAHELLPNAGGLELNLGAGEDADWFKFTATAGEIYTITTSPFTHRDGSPLLLTLYNGSEPLLTARQCSGSPGALCINSWGAPSGGVFHVKVSGEGGCPGHNYTLRVIDSLLGSWLPDPPEGFSGELLTPSSIRLTWTQPGSPFSHRLERRYGNGWLQIATTAAAVTSYVEDGLPCGQAAVYRLSAFNGSGPSPFSILAPIQTPACVNWRSLFLPLVHR